MKTSIPCFTGCWHAGNNLRGQATGQQMVLLLEPVRARVFEFDPAGISIEFAPAKPGFILRQGGESFVFTRK